ncbi:MAG TPA: glycoside hydrolase family 3 N-terminal domain-containing protein [Roseococcus sp.]|nr:glycoside hydrolase family 3 N-terminal domain-containing protein [Roseococcus sp.]
MRRAAIIGLAGTELTGEEAALLRAARPLGAILFARNIAAPPQLRALTATLRDLLGADAPILVDQEGGRVARLGPPHWPIFPPPATFENRLEAEARRNAREIGTVCMAEGLDVVCAPLLDLRLPGMHDIIGDRGFSADPAEVARLGAAWVAGLRDAGAQPVVKHIPGHGRATLDSHLALPVVEAEADDFAPFAALAAPDLWAMTAHILYPSLDPERPATLSPTVIARTIRGAIGFDGLLLSDDLGMKALSGGLGALTEACLAAGCDVALHCSGVLEESAEVLAHAAPLTVAALTRLAASRAAAKGALRAA